MYSSLHANEAVGSYLTAIPLSMAEIDSLAISSMISWAVMLVVSVMLIVLLLKTRNQLRKSKEKFKVVISELPAIVWTVDSKLVFTSSSGNGLVKLGL